MIVKKQYIPKRYRSKKLVNAGGGVAVGGSFTLGDQVDTSVFLLADKFTSLFEYDEVNDAIKAKLPFYSEGEISAYGYGGSGGGGGTGIVYNGLDSTITDIALSAYMGNVLNTTKLNVSTFNSWVSNYVPPAPTWGDLTGKPSTFPATAHTHGWGEIENKPTTFAPSAHSHTWDSIESKPSVITGTTASFTTALEAKLSGIAAGANNYTHPATHAPSIIAQDTNNRFVTDDNITTWNAKEPAITKGTTAQYFRGDMSLALFPTALPASDVSDWAKALTKPTYVWNEIGSKPTTLSEYGIASTDTMFNSKYLGISANAVSATKLVNARTIAGTSFDGTANINISYNNLTNLPSLAFLPLSGGTMTGNLTMGVTTDIITNFKTWTKDNSKSLKSFLNKFDIDANGNLVVLGNLYSTGEVTAYSSGTGVSGLKLMGDLDANGKNINNVNSISNELGLQLKVGSNTFLQLNDDGAHGMYGEYEGLTSLSAVNLFASTRVTAPEFKFGSWSFKEDSGNMVIYYNGTAKATIQSSRTNSNL